ncbi:MAG TPA: LLM class flavin-dependent oxidoreductase [Actinomycetota bacterium]|nr:LLM class flavin-dependent oxidoreductase [Actinomycetota bacterium]
MSEERQPRGLGFALRDPYAWDDLASLAREGEALGYRALFLPEISSRDTLVALNALAGETDRLLLGPGIAPLPARSTALLAMAAATVAERSGGRLLLGLGAGPPRPGALAQLRDTVLALRSLFAEGRADLAGERLTLGLRPPPVPIWIAALGPRAVRLAGAVADGVLLNWCTPDRVAQARSAIDAAAREAGRDPADVAVGVYVRAAVNDDAAAAAAVRAAAEYAGYPAYRRQFAAMGLDPEDPGAIAAAVCLVGDAGAGRGRLRAYRDAGADLPVVYPVLPHGPAAPSPARAMLRALAG